MQESLVGFEDAQYTSIYEQSYEGNYQSQYPYPYSNDLVYSVNLGCQSTYDLPQSTNLPSTCNSKKVPFQFREDLNNFHYQNLQAEKHAAMSGPQDAKINEAFQILNELDQEHDSEDEGIEDYKLGGYHPVYVGENLMNRYVVIQKLGWGHFSTVWLCRDFKYDTYVAVKIQKSAEHYIEAAYDEVEILQKVASKVNDQTWIQSLTSYKHEENRSEFNRDDCHVVQLLNSFIHRAPYGNHFCMVFEILGVNLLEVIKRYEFKGVPLNICKRIAKQALIGLDFLHRVCGVIHTDLKPENVLLQLSKEEISDIIENGQLTKNQIFKERIDIYHKIFNIQPVETKLELPNYPQNNKTIETDDCALRQINNTAQVQVAQPNTTSQKHVENQTEAAKLTKTQKKNLKKKKQKKKKQQDKDQPIITTQQSQYQEVEVSDQQSTCQETSVDGGKENPETQNTMKDIFQLNKEKISFKKKKTLDSNFSIKVADLGNACWTHHHFSTLIQTRQYRSPETIVGGQYNQTADMWSLACMLFELLTGDFLFEPKKGAHFSKNDDHLAQIQELIGKFPIQFSQRCLKAKRYFNKDGSLKRIPILNCWSLKNVLVEKYRFKLEEADELSAFLGPMLNPYPEKRINASEALQNSWLTVRQDDLYTGKMDDGDFRSWQKQKEILIQSGRYLPHPRDKNYESDEHDAGRSESLSPIKEGKDKFRNTLKKPIKPRRVQMGLVDRSFTDLGYIGFETGIDTEQLDSTKNWQFQ